jgi:AraC-like DNA-binding protein
MGCYYRAAVRDRPTEAGVASSTIRIFDDADAYYPAIRAQRVEGIVTARGSYHAELTRIDFDRLLMQRAEESLARVLLYTARPERVAIIFATDQVQSAMHVSGLALARGEMIAWDSKLEGHHRSQAACKWGSMSLTHEDLSVISGDQVGRGLTPPFCPQRFRPAVPLMSRLINLHEAAGDLAHTAPDILAAPEVARAMEQALIEAMVSCLAGGDPITVRSVHRHHSTVVRRLEQGLHANPEGPLYVSELCAMTGVSYPTLRACCQEHLGMGPKRYLLLRRMHLARRGLRQADPEKTTVTEIATLFGFWELGRFSVAYRSRFGESPSTTLRRPPEEAKLEPPWEFTKSA